MKLKVENWKLTVAAKRIFSRLGRLGLSWLVLIVFSSTSYGLAARQEPFERHKARATEVNAFEAAKVESTQSDIVEKDPKCKKEQLGPVEKACELIYQSDFDAAGELIESIPFQYNTELHRLLKIIREYQAINQQRQALRKAAYQEQLAELEKLRAGGDANDVNDVNDVNDITGTPEKTAKWELTKVFSVIAKANEFADQKQKDELLSDSFVKRTFQKAKDKASELESKGKWLDAYIICYSWLQAIDPDNQEYSDHVEQLIEKASIVASFQDSPCETRKERYENVKEETFVRAINALNFNYVSIIDYRQMAIKAIKRCELLGEVLKFPIADFATPIENQKSKIEGRKSLSSWSAALRSISDEVNQSPTGISKDKFIDIFEKVLTLNTTTVELPRPVLIAQFAEAAFSALDPYTVMVWPRQVQDFEKTMTNEFTGIGIEIGKEAGLLTVGSLLPGTPAYKSGLDAGDVIEEVDGVETKNMSLVCAVRRITGPAGTKVRLTIRSPGENKTKDISITRAKITVPTIRGWQRTEAGKWRYLIDDENKIGYIRITSFSAGTSWGIEKVLGELEAKGLRGLILDLRFNSGGLLDSAVEVTDKFVEAGPIVITRPRYWVSSTYLPAHKKGTHPDYPIVVLINRYSASASEIVAGALQDKAYERAILVGERTHGKGSVQGITLYPGGGAQLKYTMAYYHLPSGGRVESQDEMKKQGRGDWGIAPNIEVKLRSDELKKMLEVQRDNDVLVQADVNKRHASLEKHTVEETLVADPQLAIGLLVVKSKLIEEKAKETRRKAA